uniref:Tail protein n=1 Tax=viral metagenome TaxID=1070528 RepID=A0A6M3KKG2_9ZZZZ
MGAKANVLVGDVKVTMGVGINAVVIGYSIDGVSMTVRSTDANIKVEENEGTLIRRLIDQEVDVTLNLAEGTLVNLTAAIPGAVATTGAITTIGGGALQSHRLTLEGLNPVGTPRIIVLTEVNPTGEVGVPFKKDKVSIIPITFSALVADTGIFGTSTDAPTLAAAPTPTLEVGADTHAETPGGTFIHAKFSVNMTDPVGKHLEFWFTEAGVDRAFSAAALDGLDTIKLTVDGAAIAGAAVLKLYYALGTVTSAAGGVLASFANQAVVAV